MTKETANLVKETGMSQKSADLTQVYKTLAFDLPMASVRWVSGTTTDKETTLALWSGYDAGVRLATSTIDSLYRSQSLSEIVGGTVNQMLRIQQLTNAASKFFMTGLLQPPTLRATPVERPMSTQTDTISSGMTPTQARTAPRRPRQRKVRPPEPVLASALPPPQHSELQAAA